jgi:hypothetical protein
MKIVVDADACPVRDIIVKVAKEYGIEVLMVADTNHILDDGYSEVVVVEQGKDAADIALINRVGPGDIVVTQDYGVAAMALVKRAYGINHNGMIYREDNIEKLLFERHLSQKIRRAGGRTVGPKKREKEDDARFKRAFRKLCQQTVAKGKSP